MRLALLVWIAATTMAAAAWAGPSWQQFGIVSSTLGVQSSRLCIGAPTSDRGRSTNLGCPSYAPSVTSVGNLIVSGSVTANSFVGDGSGLTGVTAGSSDRIVSGTTSMVAISNTGYISLTQSGVNTGWFDPQRGFVTIGVSSTGPISGTNGYFSGNVGIGTTAPVAPLDVHNANGMTNLGSYYTGGVYNSDSVFNQYGLTFASTAQMIWRSGVGAVGDVYLSRDGANTITLSSASTKLGAANLNVLGKLGVGTSNTQATLQVSGTFIVSNSAQVTTPSIYVSTGTGNVGVGTTNPLAALQVGDTAAYNLRFANSSQPVGAYWQNEANPRVGFQNNSSGNLWWGVAFTGNTGNTSAATAGSAIGSPGVVRTMSLLTSNGSWLEERIRILGYNTTTPITSGGLVGINTSPSIPSQTLHVSGTVLTTSWTGINFSSASNVTPTAPLEVSGTISATALIINGQTITGGASGDRITSGTSSLVVNSATSTISFTTAGSQRMTIDGSGNVGIGTSAPGAGSNNSGSKLEVNGIIGSYPTNGYGKFSFGRANNDGEIASIYASSANGFNIEADGGGSFIAFKTVGTEKVRIEGSGNVGIATTAPSETLHVSGTTRLVSNVAIGMNATPSATLDVSGTMRLSDGSGAEVCDTAHYGFLRVDPATGELQRCVQ